MEISVLDPSQIEAARRVRLLLLDCDGVLTDGRLYFSAEGEELKAFDVQDGLGLVRWHRAGHLSGIVSGRSSPIVLRRAEEIGIAHVSQGVNGKIKAAEAIMAEVGIDVSETAFVGDDLPDVDVIRRVGFGVAVANAADAVKASAKFVTSRKGGRGAVREVIDLLLACQQA